MKSGYALLLSIIIAAIIMILLWLWQVDVLLPISVSSFRPRTAITTPQQTRINQTQSTVNEYNERNENLKNDLK